MKKFKHLTWNDRLTLESAIKINLPIKQIAEMLGTHESTIYRELKRGTYEHRKKIYVDKYHYKKRYVTEKRYCPEIAHEQYLLNISAKGAPIKISNDFSLANYIENKILKEKRSPDSIIGEIKRKNLEFDTSICTNTLYSYIRKGVFANISEKNLPEYNKNKKKKDKPKAKRAPRGTSIEKRPLSILDRKAFGHWEMDCVCGPTKNSFLVLTERKTRYEIIFPIKRQQAVNVVECLDKLELEYGERFSSIFKTITVDNGAEFSSFMQMERSVLFCDQKRTSVYYCHPYCSSERGSNERMNREIRRRIPKGTDLARYSFKQVKSIEEWLNTAPRRLLHYFTPKELFNAEILSIA